jgi:hypothetical protein
MTGTSADDAPPRPSTEPWHAGAARHDQAACRGRAERLFDVSQMAAGSERVYRQLAGRDHDLRLLSSTGRLNGRRR